VVRTQEFNAAEAPCSALGVFWRKDYEATSLADLMAAAGLRDAGRHTGTCPPTGRDRRAMRKFTGGKLVSERSIHFCLEAVDGLRNEI
jgi:hypothetical protein